MKDKKVFDEVFNKNKLWTFSFIIAMNLFYVFPCFYQELNTAVIFTSHWSLYLWKIPCSLCDNKNWGYSSEYQNNKVVYGIYLHISINIYISINMYKTIYNLFLYSLLCTHNCLWKYIIYFLNLKQQIHTFYTYPNQNGSSNSLL